MMKPKRLKVTRQQLEGKIFKLQRRLTKLAEQIYRTQQIVDVLKKEEDKAHAVHSTSEERGVPTGIDSQDSGGTELPLDRDDQEVLDRIREEL